MTLLAADSWLVDDGRVRGWDLHWARFRGAVGASGVAAERLDQLQDEVRAGTPSQGRWFPRVECTDRGELTWKLRVAMAREPFVSCVAEPMSDPRSSPRVKGPDLDRLTALRAAIDAGEALVAAPDGTLREGLLSSLMWWDGDVLCVVDESEAILDGVTRRLLLGLAEADGVAVERRRPLLGDLRGCEVWLTSALHGIRAVSAWPPDGPPAGAPMRAAHWQTNLEACAMIPS